MVVRDPRGDGQLRPAVALGGWIAMQGTGVGNAVRAMGDLVLTESELPVVMSRLQQGGVEQTAVHHHVLRETPRVLYMHVSGGCTEIRSACALPSAELRSGMPRSLAFRFAALLLAIVAGIAAPASALTHGWLHAHASHDRHERFDQHGLAVRSDRQAAHVDTAHVDTAHVGTAHGAEIEQQDEHHRHGHDAVGTGVRVAERQRLAVDLGVAVIVSRAELTIPDIVTAPTVSISDWESPSRPTPGGPSTTRPRAPPAS